MDDSYRQVNIWIIDANCRFLNIIKQVNFVLSSLCWGTLGMFSNDIPFWGTHFLADAGLWKFFRLLRLTNPFWPSSHVHYNMYTDYLCSLFWNSGGCVSVSRIFDFSLHFCKNTVFYILPEYGTATKHTTTTTTTTTMMYTTTTTSVHKNNAYCRLL
jgi:hypothetical protein